MTHRKLELDFQEHKELWESYNTRFYNMEMTEEEYRIALAGLGFNAFEIDIEVKDNKP